MLQVLLLMKLLVLLTILLIILLVQLIMQLERLRPLKVELLGLLELRSRPELQQMEPI